MIRGRTAEGIWKEVREPAEGRTRAPVTAAAQILEVEVARSWVSGEGLRSAQVAGAVLFLVVAVELIPEAEVARASEAAGAERTWCQAGKYRCQRGESA